MRGRPKKNIGNCQQCGNNPAHCKMLCKKCYTKQNRKERKEKRGKNICSGCLFHLRDWPYKRCKRCREKYTRNKDEEAKKRKERYLKQRTMVLETYSNGVPICNCCGETTFEFLTIDHINNNGAKERKKSGRRGAMEFVRWIIKNNYPKGLQILCWNCNTAKQYHGGCPHVEDID